MSLNELRHLIIDQYLSKLVASNKKLDADFLQQIKREDILQDYNYLCELADRTLHKTTSSLLNLVGNKQQFSVNDEGNFLIFKNKTIACDQSFITSLGSNSNF